MIPLTDAELATMLNEPEADRLERKETWAGRAGEGSASCLRVCE
jgi:hypothetical protein